MSCIFRAKGGNCRNCAASPYPACSKITKKHWTMDYRCLWVCGHLYFCTPFHLLSDLPLLRFASTGTNIKKHYLNQHWLCQKPTTLSKLFSYGLVCGGGHCWHLDLILGTPLLAQVGYFFSKLAVVTFGGAYAVLAYMRRMLYYPA